MPEKQKNNIRLNLTVGQTIECGDYLTLSWPRTIIVTSKRI